MAHKPRHPDFYIIESPCPDFVQLAMGNDPAYAELIRKEKARELPPSRDSRVVPRACLLQSEDMLMEDWYDEEKHRMRKRFKPEVVEVQADERGRIWVTKDRPDLVRKILWTLRNLKMEVKLDESGLLLPEEGGDPEETAKRPGRPPARRGPITEVGK